MKSAESVEEPTVTIEGPLHGPIRILPVAKEPAQRSESGNDCDDDRNDDKHRILQMQKSCSSKPQSTYRNLTTELER